MPASKFYLSGQVEDDGREPDLTIRWGNEGVTINGNPADKSAINRLIKDLRRARDAS